jgi:hypothetical protein
VAPDVCAHGACDDVPECEFGVCSGDMFPSMVADHHSPMQATFADGPAASCPYVDGKLPPLETLVDDSHIPEFNQRRGRRSNHHQGHKFMQEHELHQYLLGVQASLFECLDVASCYQDTELVGGELDFEFELEPSGQVSAVSVVPSESLDQPVIRACARRSVYDFKFPSYHGARMRVSYRVEIEDGY